MRDADQLMIRSLDGSSQTQTFVPADIERFELEAFSYAIRGEVAFPVSLDEVLNGVSAFEGISKSLASGGVVQLQDIVK